MDQAQTGLDIDKPGGRKDGDGTPAVIKTKPLKDGWPHLLQLYEKASDVSTDFNEAVKKIAEQCGLKSSVVKRWIRAKHNDRIAETKNEIDQLSIVFEEVTDVPASA